MNSTCPPQTILASLLDESLADAERTELERHIDTCSDCQNWLETHAERPPRAVPYTPVAVPPEAMARWLIPPVAAELIAGSRLGPYRIDAPVGRGGMAIVYRATDESLGRPVAVKVLTANLDPDSVARFLRESQAAARVRHDHVVQVFAAANPPGGPAHLVMEYVYGPTLRQAAVEARGLDPRRAAEVLTQVADAMAAAHAVGIVHRDVKPANVLLDTTTGRAKLADFGLARATDAAQLTRSGMMVGTPAYMAPEQVRNPTAADPLSDVYGLGATLYEALTGVEPFRGSLELVVAQVLADDPLPPRRLNPSVPRDLEIICLKAMSKDPAGRYSSATAMRDDLLRWRDGLPVLARPVGWLGRGRRWVKRNPTSAGLAAVLAVGGVASFATVTWLWLAAAASTRVARDSEREARQSAEVAATEQLKADQDYLRAEAVVNRFYRKLYEGGTVAAPVNLETRLELIRDAIAFYEDVARRRPGEKPPAELAAAHARKGALHNLLKETAPAAASFRAALNLFEQAERDGSTDVKVRREHAECHFYLGVSAGREGDAMKAAEHYNAAIDRLTPLAASGDPQASYFLAGALGNLAGVYEYRGERDRARATHERALPIHRQARAADPKNGGAFLDLIWTTLAVARLQPEPAQSVAAVEAAEPLVWEFVKQFASDFSRSDVVCTFHHERADALLRAGRKDEAVESAKEALKMVETIEKYPPQFQYPVTRAGAWAAAGAARWAVGDHAAAEAAWEKAATLREKHGGRSIVSAMILGKLATTYDRLAEAAARRSDAAGAETRRKRAADTRERLRKEHPEYPHPNGTS